MLVHCSGGRSCAATPYWTALSCCSHPGASLGVGFSAVWVAIDSVKKSLGRGFVGGRV